MLVQRSNECNRKLREAGLGGSKAVSSSLATQLDKYAATYQRNSCDSTESNPADDGKAELSNDSAKETSSEDAEFSTPSSSRLSRFRSTFNTHDNASREWTRRGSLGNDATNSPADDNRGSLTRSISCIAESRFESPQWETETLPRTDNGYPSTTPVVVSVKSKERWISDEERVMCVQCSTAFSFFERRHHCRLCGEVFCNSCTSAVIDFKDNTIKKCGLLASWWYSLTAYRVCGRCFKSTASIATDRKISLTPPKCNVTNNFG